MWMENLSHTQSAAAMLTIAAPFHSPRSATHHCSLFPPLGEGPPDRDGGQPAQADHSLFFDSILFY